MKTVSEYILWLDELSIAAREKNIKKSVHKLIMLLTALDKNGILNEYSIIMVQLDIMKDKIERDPSLTYGAVEFAAKTIENIGRKSYRLVKKNYYRELWTGLLLTFGLITGIIIYALTNIFVFVGIGLPLGLFVGRFIGDIFDKNAEKEGRQLLIE